MKKTVNRLSLMIFIAFTSFVQGYSQKSLLPGYIVTLGNETIRGLIKQQSDIKNMHECIYFTEGKMEKYAPGEIRAYTIEGKRIYESKVITLGTRTDMPVFAQCLTKGAVSLYLYIDKDRKRHYFLQKGEEFRKIDIDKINYAGDETSIELNRYKGQLRIFFGDCNELSDEIESAKPRNSEILDLTIKYNECIREGSSYIQHVEQKFRKGIILGYSFGNSFPVEYMEDIASYAVVNVTFTTVDPSSEFEIGWFFEFYLGASKNFSIVPAFIYSRRRIEVPFEQFPPEYYESPDGSKIVGCSYFTVPVSFRYSINKFKLKPFVETGIYFSFPPSIEGFKITEKTSPYIIPPDTPSSSLHIIWMYDYNLWGFHTGAGLKIPVTNKITFDIGVKYRFNNPFGAVEENSSTFQTLNLYLGFGF